MATIIKKTDTVTYVHGSAHDLSCLDDNSVNAVFTSTPYYDLRPYDGDPVVWPEMSMKRPFDGELVNIPAQTAALGHELNPNHFIAHLILFLREMRRITHSTGLVVVNIGDTYASGNRANGMFKEKDMMLIPERFVLAAHADGWYVRNVIPWMKDNGMPGNLDRFLVGHENIYILAQQKDYYFDRVAIRQAPAGHHRPGGNSIYKGHENETQGKHSKTLHQSALDGRNPRTKDVTMMSVLAMAEYHESIAGYLRLFITGAKAGANITDDEIVHAIVANNEQGAFDHFAPFPLSLAEMFVKCLTSDAGRCPHCHAQWHRQYEKKFVSTTTDGSSGSHILETTGWSPSCGCQEHEPETAVICDPFAGTGTVGVAAVAIRPSRRAVLCDQSEKYLREFAMKRNREVQKRLF